jgi:hypothetical protein
MRRVSIYDLTDADIDAAIAARRAANPVQPLSPAQQLERRLADMIANPPVKTPRPRKQTPVRSCSRCGIDTTKPDLCVDCEDVLALEAS